MDKRQHAPPPVSPGLIAVDVSRELWERFDRVAAERGVSRQQLLAEFVPDGMRKYGRMACQQRP